MIIDKITLIKGTQVLPTRGISTKGISVAKRLVLSGGRYNPL